MQRCKALPGQPAPDLVVDIVDGPRFDIHQSTPESFTLVVFFRGHHCSMCRAYLTSFERSLDQFESRGVLVLAVSMDNEERTRGLVHDQGLHKLAVAHSLTERTARDWGLFISDGMDEDEPRVFSEPGIALVRPDGILYGSWLQSLPFARPAAADLLGAIDAIVSDDLPARGQQAA